MTTQSMRSLAAAALVLSMLTPMLASAETGAASSTEPKVKLSEAVMQRAKTKADKEIDRRVAALNDLNTRVQSMTKVTDAFKKNLNANVQTQVTALGALKTKIDADTDGATLKADIQSISLAYRVYMLVMPQGRIAAAADREATLINMLATLGSKLQARIQAAQGAGADVTALSAALTDMGAKLADAQTRAQAAINGSATLTPDDGDKTKMAANEAALKQARTDIQAAQQDLVAARKDINTILTGLKSVKTTTTSSTTPKAQ